MRKLLIIGTGLVAAFVVACVVVVYAVTRPDPASSWKRRTPENPAPAPSAYGERLVYPPDPTYMVKAPRPLQGYPPATSATGGVAAGVPPEPKKPFDPVAHEEKRRQKREMMNRRRDGPDPGSSEGDE